jgi:hypothetical protein
MAAKSGRNPAQKTSRVSRVPGMPKVKAPGKAPAPMNAAADRKENLRRGAGPTRVGGNTPVPTKGPSASTAPDVPPGIRDLSAAQTGMTIVQRANSRGRGRGVSG